MKKKNNNEIESLDCCDFEDEGFIEGDIDFGTPVASFNFYMSENIKDSEALISPQSSSKVLPNNPTDDINSTAPRGITPPIDREFFTIKRCYQYRPSTVRKLNELKANHPNINVYLNTILDEAILHYHNFIFNENGSFKKTN